MPVDHETDEDDAVQVEGDVVYPLAALPGLGGGGSSAVHCAVTGTLEQVSEMTQNSGTAR